MHSSAAFFVIRPRSNTRLRRLDCAEVDKSTGLRCDQTVVLTGVHTPDYYPEKLRRIKFLDSETGKVLVFLTNNFTLPALTVAELYRNRWQVELFFKWITEHKRHRPKIAAYLRRVSGMREIAGGREGWQHAGKWVFSTPSESDLFRPEFRCWR